MLSLSLFKPLYKLWTTPHKHNDVVELAKWTSPPPFHYIGFRRLGVLALSVLFHLVFHRGFDGSGFWKHERVRCQVDSVARTTKAMMLSRHR